METLLQFDLRKHSIDVPKFLYKFKRKNCGSRLLLQQPRPVVDRRRDIGVLAAKNFLLYRLRPRVQRLRLGELALNVFSTAWQLELTIRQRRNPCCAIPVVVQHCHHIHPSAEHPHDIRDMFYVCIRPSPDSSTPPPPGCKSSTQPPLGATTALTWFRNNAALVLRSMAMLGCSGSNIFSSIA